MLPSRKTMESEALSLLCDPDTRYSFERDGQTLRNTATGRVYPIRDGIPIFISSLTGADLRAQTRYDRVAPFYDLKERVQRWANQAPNYRPELAAVLAVAPGSRVLEVAVGTGANVPHLPAEIDFYGIDLSWGMLRKCRRNLRKWGRSGHLFHGEAGRLPFCSAVFDCVFAVGGVGIFPAPERAVAEMVWVARPGGRIVIADEFGKGAGHAEGEMPAYPMHLVPEGMEEIEARTLSDSRFYCISFRKPGMSTGQV